MRIEVHRRRNRWFRLRIRNFLGQCAQEIITFLLKDVLSIPESLRKGFNSFSEPRVFSFEFLGFVGETICFIDNPKFKEKVDSDKEVEFEEILYKLSALTRELKRQCGKQTPSEAYQGDV